MGQLDEKNNEISNLKLDLSDKDVEMEGLQEVDI